MTAGPLDVISIGDARVAAGYSFGDGSKDLRLQPLLTAVSLKLDELVGPIIQRSVTERLDGGRQYVRLRRWPVASVTSVTEYLVGAATTLSAETLTAAGTYLAERSPDDSTLYTGVVWRRVGFNNSWFPAGKQNVVITATAGRFADVSAAAGSRFAQAARMAVKANWAGELNAIQNVNEYDVPMASFPTITIPRVAVDMLADQVQYVGMA